MVIVGIQTLEELQTSIYLGKQQVDFTFKNCITRIGLEMDKGLSIADSSTECEEFSSDSDVAHFDSTEEDFFLSLFD